MTDTASRIAAAARELLAEEGSTAVTMRRIGGKIGLSGMAVYRHYPSRDALLAHLADGYFAELAERWSDLPTTAPDEALHLGLERMTDFALAEPRVYTFLFTEQRPGAREFGELRAGNSPTFNLVVAAVKAQMDAGRLRRDDPWLVGLTITSHLHGLIGLHLGGRIGLPDGEFRELCRQSLERILHGLRD
ncbi:TetR/AcrR family transcriptional regulator [Phytomonospora sp. NPDC050363]|uniref:TetR/AcrR family transcriptional regulator n=1 Tax=Phytomonospora sp. NPDC050363 TaxID=3155642 RepID=UPI0033C32973